MKRHFRHAASAAPDTELVPTFGGAQIVKHHDGRLEIRGGSDQETFQAHDRMKDFLSVTPLTVQRVH